MHLKVFSHFSSSPRQTKPNFLRRWMTSCAKERALRNFSSFLRWRFFQKPAAQELQNFCFTFGHLYQSGLPSVRILALLQESLPSQQLRTLCSKSALEVQNGSLLSETFEQFPKIFDPLFLAFIRAGEKSGKLSQVFFYLSNHYETDSQIRTQIYQASLYPLLSLGLSLILILYLMAFVVPELCSFLKEIQPTLPLATRLLISLAQGVSEFLFAGLGISLTLFIVFQFFYRSSEKIRFLMDSFMLKLPYFGRLIQEMLCARSLMVLSLTLKAKLPLTEGLKLARATGYNAFLKSKFHEMERLILQGYSWSEGFRCVRIFSPLILQMIQLGEHIGSVSEALDQGVRLSQTNIQKKIQTLLTLLHPVLLCLVGSLIFWIALALFLPLYDQLSLWVV